MTLFSLTFLYALTVSIATDKSTGEPWKCDDWQDPEIEQWVCGADCKGFNVTMTVQTLPTLGTAYVSEVQFFKPGCAALKYTSPCSFLDCPSIMIGGVSINFVSFQFTPQEVFNGSSVRSNVSFSGLYTCPGSGSVYQTGLEWSAALGVGDCVIPSNHGSPVGLVFAGGLKTSGDYAVQLV